MSTLELVIKFSAFGLLVMLALLMLVLQRKTWPGRLLILLSLSLAALLLSTSRELLNMSNTAYLIFAMLNVPNTILVWLFAKSLLDENFKMGWLNWGIAISWCVPVWIMRLDHYGYYSLLPSSFAGLMNIYACLLFLYIVFFAIRGWADDLVEPRRRLRRVFVIGVLVLSLFAIISEFYLPPGDEVLLGTFKLMAIFPPLIAAYFWIFAVRPNHFAFGNRQNNKEDVSGEGGASRFVILKEKLNQEMLEKKAWRETGLTIPILAKRLGTTQHQLRALINQEMGFQNFRSFLNQYRVNAVKEVLANPEHTHIPILTIALENGFNSLPPFNRAFKAITGVTPTVFRQNSRQ
jgi:AraC-like DNA-binding protein